MIEILRRSFTVELTPDAAWNHLARVQQWPSWAKHIRRVELEPPGELTEHSRGAIHLTNGLKPVFEVTEFAPPHHWAWIGRFLWLAVRYDHLFEEVTPQRTSLTFVVEADGMGATVIGRLFAKIYAKNLDKAIPNLVQQMNRASR